MGKKGSYLKKHISNVGLETFNERAPFVKVNISDEKRLMYEEGQVILLDKPVHWTSFDVVRKIRKIIKVRKVGHAGTLDPLASGLLIICTGKYTKKINEYMAQEKEYTGSFTLGAVTPTYDLESLPEQPKEFAHLTESQIKEATQNFIGDIEQFPPIYSAIKQEGKPLYELARRGKDIELQARKVFIKSFEIVAVDLPLVEFKIVCSTGTYIRSVANDFGAALGCGAYLSGLRRTAIGDFKSEDAVTMDAFVESLI